MAKARKSLSLRCLDFTVCFIRFIKNGFSSSSILKQQQRRLLPEHVPETTLSRFCLHSIFYIWIALGGAQANRLKIDLHSVAWKNSLFAFYTNRLRKINFLNEPAQESHRRCARNHFDTEPGKSSRNFCVFVAQISVFLVISRFRWHVHGSIYSKTVNGFILHEYIIHSIPIFLSLFLKRFEQSSHTHATIQSSIAKS